MNEELRNRSAFRPEAELLLCSARTCLEPPDSERLATLLRQKLDWDYLLSLASFHGMKPLLYRHLRAAGLGAVPQPVLEQLQNHYRDVALRNLAATGALLELMQLFATRGIRAVPYKGPTLAVSVYGNVALRQFNDLDLLLCEQDIFPARDLLIARGYRPLFSLTPAQEAAHLRSIGQLPLKHPDRNVQVDLHAKIMPRWFPFSINLEYWEGRLETLSLGGQEVPVLAREDLLLVLCVHGAKHLWAGLDWIRDVAELIRVYPDMNWERVLRQAKEMHSVRMVLLGVFLASAVLGAILPEKVRSLASSDSAIPALVRDVTERLFRDNRGVPGIAESLAFYFKVLDRPRDRLRSCLHLALVPTVADWQLLSLPPVFSFLYYLIRPSRLLVIYGRKLWRACLRKIVYGARSLAGRGY